MEIRGKFGAEGGFALLRWVGALYFFRSAISSRCIARMLLLAPVGGAQGLYSGTSQCGSHPGGPPVGPASTVLGQHAGTG